MSDWQPLLGRITIFPAALFVPSAELPSALELFQKMWDAAPLNFQGPTNPLSPSSAQGKRAGLGVSCSVHPLRIDFTLSPVGRETSSELPRLAVIEDSKEFYDELARVARTLGRGLVTNSIVRVATFVQVISPAANSTEANVALMSIVPTQYRIALGNEEEFILQVNRPRTSEQVEKLKMNFITKWSVENFQIISVSVSGDAGTPLVAPQSSVPQVAQFIAASVAFDNNNVPVSPDKPLSSSQQASLLLEGLAGTATSLREGNLNIGKGFESGKFAH